MGKQISYHRVVRVVFFPEGRGRVPSPSPPSRARSAQAAAGGTAAEGESEGGKGINKRVQQSRIQEAGTGCIL